MVYAQDGTRSTGGWRGSAEGDVPAVRPLPKWRHGRGREMPGFIILDWRVVRFIPSRAAAPFRAAQHPPGLAEDAQDVVPFGVGQGARRSGRRPGLRGRGLQVGGGGPGAMGRGEDDRPLDDVLVKLPDVARPGVADQGVHDRGRDGLDPPTHPPGEPLGEMADQPRDVVTTLPQRRQHQREDVKPVVEVFTETGRRPPAAPDPGSWPPPAARPP